MLSSLILIAAATLGDADAADLEAFEKEVRPILVERCQGCHGPDKQKGDLRLDSRASALAGGKAGPAVVPGNLEESLLVEAINYGDFVQMPPKSRLPQREIDALTRWVERGAAWPAEATGGIAATAKKAFNLAERAKHWSLQPIARVAPPSVRNEAWPASPIDRFVLAAMEAKGLEPAPDADRRTLLRRVTFDLTGLPPTPAEIAAFLADDSPAAYARVVDRLLASPHYGERWGRHWLDLVRFAETAGHEFDYDIPGAWRYRDYVVRAFNDDLPYDQFLTEHVAGDLLETPRRGPETGRNESILATGFYFLGEGVHSPVDVREDEVLRIDNQIDVLSKAFLGLTVSCARCHDHKFDAISTKDYYALAGYFQSSRHQQAFLDAPVRVGAKVAELEALQKDIRTRGFALREDHAASSRVVTSPAAGSDPPPDSVVFEDFDRPDFGEWAATGAAFGRGPSGEESLRIGEDGPSPVTPGVAHSGLVSDRLEGVLRSPTFPIERDFVLVRAWGRSGRINVVIDGFEKIRDPIYGGLTRDVNSETPSWIVLDLTMWKGHRAYLEFGDGATLDFQGSNSTRVPGGGYLAVDEVRFADGPSPPSSSAPAAPAGRIERDDAAIAPLLARYRAIEATIPDPALATAILDGTSEDEHVLIRGSSRTPGEVVPRRFLEAIAGAEQPAPASGSGRLDLARRMLDPSCPLPARVMANRIWKGHFGVGLVRTPDDFGVMGEAPSHPELLDWLAFEFRANGWSVKAMHRLILLSRAYRMASVPADSSAEEADPTNRLLHRSNVRRLEAEAVRDAMLAISGRLDPRLGGPSVPPHLTAFMQGRGRPGASGPLDGDGRRSLYLNVRRNFLNPMLLAFDFPAPASTMGRRNVSNVPAQALTLLDDPFVLEQSRLWAARLLADPGRSQAERVDAAYEAAFARLPTASERAEALAFLASHPAPDGPDAWADLAHVLFNVKEFLFVP